jgi:hypothetical protein
MNTAKSVNATFTPVAAGTLVITVKGSGTVSALAGRCIGTATTKTCIQKYAAGRSVTLTAKPSKKNSFLGWSGACTGTGPCVLSMTTDRAVTATFKKPLTPPACKVPKVVGKTLKKAKAAIKKAHCGVGKVTKKTSPASKKGKVIKQSPKAGKKLKNGAKIRLTVGKGP